MYRIEYLPIADTDIEEAEKSLEQYSASAADKLGETIIEKTANLIDFPFMYPISEYDDDLRCMPLPHKYLLFYRVHESAELIQIYRVLHGMRDLADIFSP